MNRKRTTTNIPVKTIVTGTTIAAIRLASRVLLLLLLLGTAAVETSLVLTGTPLVANPVVLVCTEAEMLENWSSGI